jgi:hypothetical protein
MTVQMNVLDFDKPEPPKRRLRPDGKLNSWRGPSVWRWWTEWIYIAKCYLWRRWHVVKCPTLWPTYHEPSELILHASMTCLVSFVEEQAHQVDWTWNERVAHAKAEMDAIYEWWTVGRHEERARARRLRSEWYEGKFNGGEGGNVADGSAATGRSAEALRACEEANDAREQEMLHRLINIRMFLWT